MDGIFQVHHLAAQGLSQRAISRQTGFNRRTVKNWLQQEKPVVEDHPQTEGQEVQVKEAISPDFVPGLNSSPPKPWSSWQEVQQVREALQEHRFLFLRRPNNLSQSEQAHLHALLRSPIGERLQIPRTFIEEWYALFKDETGKRWTLAEAWERYDTWRTNPIYQEFVPLRRALERISALKFARLSQFLRHAEWEATNNGAERTGRAFRHRQVPHFSLRSPEAIRGSIQVAAIQQMRRSKAVCSNQKVNASTRGRKPRIPVVQPIRIHLN